MQIKYTAIAAVVLALGAGAAQAKIAQPSTGNGELFLSLYDTRGTDAFSDDKTLVVDLGAILGTGGNAAGRVNNWLSNNTTAADPVFDMAKSTHGYSITVLDPKVVAFLQNGSFDNMLWSVVAGDSAGRDRVLTTVNGSASAQNAAAFRNASTVIAQFSTNTNQGPEGDNIAESTNASSLFIGDGAANLSRAASNRSLDHSRLRRQENPRSLARGRDRADEAHGELTYTSQPCTRLHPQDV